MFDSEVSLMEAKNLTPGAFSGFPRVLTPFPWSFLTNTYPTAGIGNILETLLGIYWGTRTVQ